MIRNMRTAAILAALSIAAPALADVPKWENEANAQTCAESFPERLADFREGVPEFQQYVADYNRVMPWFHEHCRWLTDREIAIRQIDDAAAFVCDTQRGRPRGLTTEFALDHARPVSSPVLFIQHREANRWCAQYDAAERVSLALSQADEPAVALRVVVEGMCWRVESRKCAKERAKLQELTAKLATP